MTSRPSLAATLAVVVVAAAALAGGAGAAPTTVYDNIPAPQPGNVPSVAFEATSASEFGGRVQLAGTARRDPTITVLMSSWGCQTGHWYSGDCATTPGSTFTEPITVNVYAVGAGGAVGALLATQTQTFALPYRPSADAAHCTGGRWYSTADATCYNGLATPIAFTLTGATLPDDAIVSVAYNTTHHGYTPYGEATACYTSPGGCGYDSLNVGTHAAPSTGSAPPNDAYYNTAYAPFYCDGGAGGSGVFRLDAGCWTGYLPAIAIAATAINPPADAEACKKGGWETATRNDGSTFTTQGDCIQYVNTGK